MKILFAGTPDLAVPCLRGLAAQGLVCGVLTAVDAPAGRRNELQAPPVKTAALELGLPVLQFDSLKAPAREAVGALKPDLLVSFAFGKIFGPQFLGLFPLGGVNIHPSLLPRWRGPSPLNAALAALDPKTGLTIQTLALEMDAGDILWQKELPLTGRETLGDLSLWAQDTAVQGILEVVGAWNQVFSGRRAQDSGEITLCHLLKKDDGLISWGASAQQIDALVRAYQGWPGAFTGFKGQKLMLLKTGFLPQSGIPGVPGQVLGIDKALGILVQTGEGLLAIQELQLQGKKPLDFKSFLNGCRDFLTAVLGETTP